MRIDVAFTPTLLQQPEKSVCIVVDVLRASSACVAMFERGVVAVAVAPDPDAARALHQQAMPDALLCGEVGGLPPEGFDYGNSPDEFFRLDLTGRRCVMSTSNGTRALHAVAMAPAVLVGCLLNRAAVCGRACRTAHDLGVDLLVVCAGNDYGASVSLDDAFTAGALVTLLEGLARSAEDDGGPLLSDAALMSKRLFASYGEDGLAAFREGSHGRTLDRLGFATDLGLCATLDRSRSVPVLHRRDGGTLMLARE